MPQFIQSNKTRGGHRLDTFAFVGASQVITESSAFEKIRTGNKMREKPRHCMV
jgi:hypothetical protein